MCVVSEAGGEMASTAPDTSAAAEDDCNTADEDDSDAIIFLRQYNTKDSSIWYCLVARFQVEPQIRSVYFPKGEKWNIINSYLLRL